jgi:KTSC domain
MRIATVESATLATVGYDEVQELLQLEFGSRAVYLYFNVPVSVHEALLDAPSKGRYFNGAIRGRYPFRQIQGANLVLQNAEVAARCDR